MRNDRNVMVCFKGATLRGVGGFLAQTLLKLVVANLSIENFIFEYLKEDTILMNDFPLIGDPSYAHRIMGSPGGKHCKSLEGNVRSKAVFSSKTLILGKD